MSEDLLVVNAKPVKSSQSSSWPSVSILLSTTVLLGLEYLFCGKVNSFVLLFLGLNIFDYSNEINPPGGEV